MDYAKYQFPNAGYDGDKERCKELELGKLYELTYVSMGQSHTSIRLKGFEGTFNSINFSFWTDDTESGELERFHLQEREEYNPYYHLFGWDKGRKQIDDDEEEDNELS